MDTNGHARPSELDLRGLMAAVRECYQELLLIADIATVEDARYTAEIGFGCVGTMLHSYIMETEGQILAADECRFMLKVLATVAVPVIAEGNVETPEMAANCLALSAHAVVVGGAMTRTQQIIRRFVSTMI